MSSWAHTLFLPPSPYPSKLPSPPLSHPVSYGILLLQMATLIIQTPVNDAFDAKSKTLWHNSYNSSVHFLRLSCLAPCDNMPWNLRSIFSPIEEIMHQNYLPPVLHQRHCRHQQHHRHFLHHRRHQQHHHCNFLNHRHVCHQFHKQKPLLLQKSCGLKCTRTSMFSGYEIIHGWQRVPKKWVSYFATSVFRLVNVTLSQKVVQTYKDLPWTDTKRLRTIRELKAW